VAASSLGRRSSSNGVSIDGRKSPGAPAMRFELT